MMHARSARERMPGDVSFKHAWCGVNYMHILLKRSIICVTGTCHAALVNYLGEACSGRLSRKHATYPYTNYMATTVSITVWHGEIGRAHV